MKNTAAIILAAGLGTRMKSCVPKVLQELHHRPLLSFLLNTLDKTGVKKKVLVVNEKEKNLRRTFGRLKLVKQKKPLGSADAVKACRAHFSGFKGNILVFYGDTPFVRQQTIKKLIGKRQKEKSSCTILTSFVEKPSGYGRVIRDKKGSILKIVEEKDASPGEKAVKEINVGCYCFKKDDLFSNINEIKINAKKKEYYLTDMIEVLSKKKKKLSSVSCEDPFEYFGVNSKFDLARAENMIKKKVLEKLMEKGVTILDPASTYVDKDAKIGKDTIIYPYTFIEKDVKVGKSCKIGPVARLRPGTEIADEVEIGNFVELVRTKVSSGTKIKHMTYLGDTVVGKNANIGAGAITANFDGEKKNKTVIGEGAFIGVGAILIAPLKIGYKALVGAGSVVTKNKDVPPRATVAGIPAKILRKKK